MKAVYLTNHPMLLHSGVAQKVAACASEWTRQGVLTQIYDLSSGYILTPDTRAHYDLTRDGKEGGAWSSFLLRQKQQQFKWALEEIRRFSPDFIYMREDIFSPALYALLQKYPTFIEINSIQINELRRASILKPLYCQLTSPFLLRNARGLIGVTAEILSAIKATPEQSIVIANGIRIDPLDPFVEFPIRPQLLFVGDRDQPWHGVDTILEFASIVPEMDFHLVGVSGDSTENCIFYGYQPREFINQLCQKSTAAISTLGLYCKKMEEACPLKSRLYLERGLPIIIGYSDPDINGQMPFVLRVANKRSSLLEAQEEVTNFITRVHGNLEVRAHARSFAETHLSSVIKEKQRLSFIKEKLLGAA
jgi:glycosyltransferase involved in cell wall biosynthesis